MVSKKIVSNILFIVLTILLVVILGLLLTGHKLFYVKTSSMEPDIKQWSLVIDKTYKTKEEFYNNVNLNDDITFRTNNGNIVTHRIIYLDYENDVITTQGIKGNASIDSSISYDNVLGVVVFSIPYIGFLVMMLQTWYFWVMFSCIIAVIIILKSLMKQIKK